jgi:hypothetical protein
VKTCGDYYTRGIILDADDREWPRKKREGREGPK